MMDVVGTWALKAALLQLYALQPSKYSSYVARTGLRTACQVDDRSTIDRSRSQSCVLKLQRTAADDLGQDAEDAEGLRLSEVAWKSEAATVSLLL